jgi:hypothetical protein
MEEYTTFHDDTGATNFNAIIERPEMNWYGCKVERANGCFWRINGILYSRNTGLVHFLIKQWFWWRRNGSNRRKVVSYKWKFKVAYLTRTHTRARGMCKY